MQVNTRLLCIHEEKSYSLSASRGSDDLQCDPVVKDPDAGIRILGSHPTVTGKGAILGDLLNLSLRPLTPSKGSL